MSDYGLEKIKRTSVFIAAADASQKFVASIKVTN
jgi:hypothetical protein